MITATIESSNLNRVLGDLQRALSGSGQASDLPTIVKDESRRLAMEISNDTPPKSKGRLEKKIAKDVGQAFATVDGNIEARAQGKGDMRWLVAGPKFLYGIRPDQDMRKGGGDLLSIYRKLRGKDQGKKLIPLGNRGHQKVYRINRIIVQKKAKTGLARQLMGKVGRWRASWAASAMAMGETLIPAWVKRHIPSPKAVTELGGLANASRPSVLFGSHSPGVMKQADRIRKALVVRQKKIVARIKYILNGYKMDVKQRVPIRPRGKESAYAAGA